MQCRMLSRLFLSSLLLLLHQKNGYAAKPRPNIIMMVVDDLGWADHELNEVETDIATPHLKDFAREGTMLTNFYTQQVCSPTRSSLMTGLYPFRIGMQHSTTLSPGTTAALPLEVPTIAELLKLEGYSTYMLGKWHLGMAKWKNTPHGRGFDYFRGYLQGQEDYWNKTILGGFDFFFLTENHPQRVDWGSNGEYSLIQYERWFEDILHFHNHTREPFFIYYSFQTVHIPIQQEKEEERCSKIENKWRRMYCGMIVELDDSIGRSIDFLKSTGDWDNTLILFTTDNGGMVMFAEEKNGEPIWPASVGSNYPLRGSKTSLLEGGVRATAFLSGGSKFIPHSLRGNSFDGLMHAVDFPAMALEASGSFQNRNLNLDGRSPFTWGNLMLPRRNDVPVNINFWGFSFSAIRFGDMKLIIGNPTMFDNDGYFPIGAKPREPAPPISRFSRFLLFNITADPNEKHDLSKDQPEQIKIGHAILRKYIASGYRNPQLNVPHPLSNPILHGGVWKPFLHLASAESTTMMER